MRKRRLLSAALCAVALVGLNAHAAFAQGQVERGPENARSICSFSGLNDDPHEPFPEDGRTQSYGQLVQKGVLVPSEIKSGVPSPGTLCNPNVLSLK
jgi:hypothetical protein